MLIDLHVLSYYMYSCTPYFCTTFYQSLHIRMNLWYYFVIASNKHERYVQLLVILWRKYRFQVFQFLAVIQEILVHSPPMYRTYSIRRRFPAAPFWSVGPEPDAARVVLGHAPVASCISLWPGDSGAGGLVPVGSSLTSCSPPLPLVHLAFVGAWCRSLQGLQKYVRVCLLDAMLMNIKAVAKQSNQIYKNLIANMRQAMSQWNMTASSVTLPYISLERAQEVPIANCHRLWAVRWTTRCQAESRLLPQFVSPSNDLPWLLPLSSNSPGHNNLFLQFIIISVLWHVTWSS